MFEHDTLWSDNGRPCGCCGGTCKRFDVERDTARGTTFVEALCIGCKAETRFRVGWLVSDASGASSADRTRVAS